LREGAWRDLNPCRLAHRRQQPAHRHSMARSAET
jgi:hypothetical protein